MIDLKKLKWNSDGLIPAIVQDATNNQVVMLAYMNEESLNKTIESGTTWFFSRSRKELWNKGKTSGNTQKVLDLLYDCDADTLLVKVVQKGNACHTGEYSCFHNYLVKSDEVIGGDSDIVDRLYRLIKERKDNPVEGSYTNYLFNEGIDKILKKVGEESAEVIIGAKNADRDEITYETCDLVYHTLVMLVDRGVDLDSVRHELNSRHIK